MHHAQRIVRSTLWITCLLLIGCLGSQGGEGSGSPHTSGTQVDSTAVAALARVKRSLLDGATENLRHYEYVRERAVSVTDESGGRLLHHAHTTRFYGPPERRNAEVMDTTSIGAGNADFWAAYSSSPSAEDTVNWSIRLLEEEPVVLSVQGAAYYQYTVLEDSTIGGTPVMRIQAVVIPGSDRSGIQSARFYIERESDALVGFELEFVQRSLLFDEESRFRYMLSRQADGIWLPFEVGVNTFLNLPLSKGQRFMLQARYVPVE